MSSSNPTTPRRRRPPAGSVSTPRQRSSANSNSTPRQGASASSTSTPRRRASASVTNNAQQRVNAISRAFPRVPPSVTPLNGPAALQPFTGGLAPVAEYTGVTASLDSRSASIARMNGTSKRDRDNRLTAYNMAFVPLTCNGFGCAGAGEDSHPALKFDLRSDLYAFYELLTTCHLVMGGNLGRYVDDEGKLDPSEVFSILNTGARDHYDSPDCKAKVKWPSTFVGCGDGRTLNNSNAGWCIGHLAAPSTGAEYPVTLVPLHGGANGRRTTKAWFTVENLDNVSVTIGTDKVVFCFPSYGRVRGSVLGLNSRLGGDLIWTDDVAEELHYCLGDRICMFVRGFEQYRRNLHDNFPYMAQCSSGSIDQEVPPERRCGKWRSSGGLPFPLSLAYASASRPARPSIQIPSSSTSRVSSTSHGDMSPSSELPSSPNPSVWSDADFLQSPRISSSGIDIIYSPIDIDSETFDAGVTMYSPTGVHEEIQDADIIYSPIDVDQEDISNRTALSYSGDNSSLINISSSLSVAEPDNALAGNGLNAEVLPSGPSAVHQASQPQDSIPSTNLSHALNNPGFARPSASNDTAVPHYLQGDLNLPEPQDDLAIAIEDHKLFLQSTLEPTIEGPDLQALCDGIFEVAMNAARLRLKASAVLPSALSDLSRAQCNVDVTNLVQFVLGCGTIKGVHILSEASGRGPLVTALHRLLQRFINVECESMTCGSSFRTPYFNPTARANSERSVEFGAWGGILGLYIVLSSGNVDLSGLNPFLLIALGISHAKEHLLVKALTPALIYQVEPKFEDRLRALFLLKPGDKFEGPLLSQLFGQYTNTRMDKLGKLTEVEWHDQYLALVYGCLFDCPAVLSSPEFQSMKTGFTQFSGFLQRRNVKSVIGTVCYLMDRRMKDMDDVEREISRIKYCVSDDKNKAMRDFCEVVIKEVVTDFLLAGGDFAEARDRVETLLRITTDSDASPVQPIGFTLSEIPESNEKYARALAVHTCFGRITFPLNEGMLELTAFSYSKFDAAAYGRPGDRLTFPIWFEDQVRQLALLAKGGLYNNA